MNQIYNLSHRLVAYVLFIGLFLQSCGGFQNEIALQKKKESIRRLELSGNSLMNTNKEIVISGGYLTSFYEEDGELKADLRADAIQPQPNYKRIPVVIEEGTNLAELTKLDPTTQQNRIQFKAPKSGQPGYVKVFGGAMKGGMMEGDTEEIRDGVIPNECFCPITQEIMEDPVIAQDGHTYERIAIQKWFDRGGRISPKTGARLLSIELISNYTMRSLIQDLKEQMPVLARHTLNIDNIEAAIKLREEFIQEELELKGNLLQQEQQKSCFIRRTTSQATAGDKGEKSR